MSNNVVVNMGKSSNRHRRQNLLSIDTKYHLKNWLEANKERIYSGFIPRNQCAYLFNKECELDDLVTASTITWMTAKLGWLWHSTVSEANARKGIAAYTRQIDDMKTLTDNLVNLHKKYGDKLSTELKELHDRLS